MNLCSSSISIYANIKSAGYPLPLYNDFCERIVNDVSKRSKGGRDVPVMVKVLTFHDTVCKTCYDQSYCAFGVVQIPTGLACQIENLNGLHFTLRLAETKLPGESQYYSNCYPMRLEWIQIKWEQRGRYLQFTTKLWDLVVKPWWIWSRCVFDKYRNL